MRLCVDAIEFWRSLSEDIRLARDYVYVQTLSLEGDRVGKALVESMRDAACRDRRILVDSFTKVILSDRFLYAPRNWFDAELRAEARETARMIRQAPECGIDIRFTNPLGPLLLELPARNHKKLVVIDDRVCYIGGLNFSEHNFRWHDLMLRIEDADVAAFLRDDFLATWDGADLRRFRSFGSLELYTFDGRSNDSAFAGVFGLLDGAKEQIHVASPYLSFPFLEHLVRAKRRGVGVTLVSPSENNHELLKRYTIWESARHGFDLWLYQGRMSHLKLMLIDGRWLVLGSSNFDWLSYYLHQDVVAVVRDPDVVAEFQRRVLARDLEQSVRFDGPVGSLAGRVARYELRLAAVLSRLATRRGGLLV